MVVFNGVGPPGTGLLLPAAPHDWDGLNADKTKLVVLKFNDNKVVFFF